MALTTQDLFEIRKIIVASKLLDSGAFDADIQRMEEASAAQRQLANDNLAFEKQKIMKSVQAEQDAVDAKIASADAKLAEIESNSKALEDKQAQTTKMVDDASTQMSALAESIKKTEKSVAAMNADVDKRIKETEQRERDVSLREAALAQGQQDLAAKLDTIKSLSV